MKRTLIFHCLGCHDSSVTPVTWQDRTTYIQIACTKCGERYTFDPARDRKHSDEAYFAYVRGYAERVGLDLPRAYSVLEGFASLDDARAATRKIPGADVPKQIGGAWAVTILLAVVVAIPIGYGWRIWSHEGAEAMLRSLPFVPSSATTDTSGDDGNAEPRAAVRMNGDGDPLEVRARDPYKVLQAYCQVADIQERRVPLGIIPAPPPNDAMRIGVYLDYEDYTVNRGIRIFRDPRLHRWVARGDGTAPIDWITVDDTLMSGRMTQVPRIDLTIEPLSD